VRTGRPDHDELLGIADGEEAEDELIKEGEDGGIGADSQGERGDSDDGEEGRPAEVAEGEADIGENSEHMGLYD
jgi:hypothetical protein